MVETYSKSGSRLVSGLFVRQVFSNAILYVLTAILISLYLQENAADLLEQVLEKYGIKALA